MLWRWAGAEGRRCLRHRQLRLLGGFLIIGMLSVVIGGEMYIDFGGALLPFVIGGVIELKVNAIYRKGAADASPGAPEPPDPTSPEPPPNGSTT